MPTASLYKKSPSCYMCNYISIYNLKRKKCADCAAFEVNCLIIKYKWAVWLVVNLAQTLPPVSYFIKTHSVTRGQECCALESPLSDGRGFFWILWNVQRLRGHSCYYYFSPPPFSGLLSSLCWFMRSQLPQPVRRWKSHCS